MKFQVSIHAGRVVAAVGLMLGMIGACGWRAGGGAEPGSPAPATPAASTAAREYQALVKDFSDRQQAFFEQYHKAKTDAEREKLGSLFPAPQEAAVRFLALAEKYPNDPAALDAVSWILENAPYAPVADRGLEIVQQRYLTSDRLGPICYALSDRPTPAGAQLLREILAKNPSRAVRGPATVSLALELKALGGDSEAPGHGKAAAESERLLTEAARDYGEVPYGNRTVAQAAQAELFEIQHLAIGKEAPEIEGQDVEGKAFKLSAYRGKVVVIDFWGDW